MNAILLCALLTIGASAEASTATDRPLENGTLLFLENCNSFVEFTTRAKIGHVALAFVDGQDVTIYEATPAQVRRVGMDEYFTELARLNKRRDDDEQVRVWALRPKQPYSDAEV